MIALSLKLGLLSIRSLTSKAVIVNNLNTGHKFDALCLTETWIRPEKHLALNEATPTGYSYVHRPHLNGRGGGLAIIYINSLGINQKAGCTFSSETLFLNKSDQGYYSEAAEGIRGCPRIARGLPLPLPAAPGTRPPLDSRSPSGLPAEKPMQVDSLRFTSDGRACERACRLLGGLCQYCGVSGHLIRNCGIQP